jgi:hypothetical protein
MLEHHFLDINVGECPLGACKSPSQFHNFVKCGPLIPGIIHFFHASCIGLVPVLQNYHNLVLVIFVGYLLECS